MELTERIQTKKIAFLNAMELRAFKQYSKNCKNDDERKVKFNMMKAFCATNIKTRGETKRIYSYTQTTPLDVGGRLYCGNSIQGLQKDIRGFLMDGVSTDIDMKNCHPVILRYLCKINNIPCPNLSWYIDNRDTVLRDFDEDGKTLFLVAVNNDKLNKKTTNQFFKDFDKECKLIQKQMTSLPCYKHIVDSVPTTRLYNFLGSAINRILCVWENKILQSVVSVLNSKQIEICALMFDGLLIYGDYNKNTELITNIESKVAEDFEGLNMRFAYKEHSKMVLMPDDFTEESPEKLSVEDEKTFEYMSAEFEKTHAKITNAGIFVKEYPDKIVAFSRTGIVTAYESMTYDKLIEKKNGDAFISPHNFIKDWLVNNPSIRSYTDMGCYPDQDKCPTDYYNTWRPFAMELVKDYDDMPDALELIKKHILILAGNEPEVASYLESWIAQMIQYPSVKTICPTLISKEGAGKGTLMMLLQKMIGEKKYFETPTPSKTVFGNFNGEMANSFLVNLDELSKKEMTDCEGYFKSLTTNPMITINEKGVKSYTINSYHRFIITTNKEDPITSKKDDRRNLIIRSSDELIGRTEYFNELYALLGDVNVIKTCYEYFKGIPNMADFKNIPMPKTAYQRDIQESAVCPIEMWLKDLATKNHESKELVVSVAVQYTLFTEWCSKCGINYEVSNVQFGVRLKRLNIDGVGERVHGKSGDKRTFDIQKMISHFKINIGCLEDVEEEEVL